MNDLIDLTASRIDTVIREHGSMTLTRLEYAIDASYNLIFLAVERLVAKGKLRIEKSERDYIVYLPSMEVDERSGIPV
ncbi:MAG: hypothetical protein IT393_07505 [Nitrospirae bacterium]|nr:hypothetical protein [Nitrospirota bacterium]